MFLFQWLKEGNLIFVLSRQDIRNKQLDYSSAVIISLKKEYFNNKKIWYPNKGRWGLLPMGKIIAVLTTGAPDALPCKQIVQSERISKLYSLSSLEAAPRQDTSCWPSSANREQKRIYLQRFRASVKAFFRNHWFHLYISVHVIFLWNVSPSLFILRHDWKRNVCICLTTGHTVILSLFKP